MKLSGILVIEDEVDVRELLSLHLERAGYAVTAVATGEEALTLSKENEYDLAVVDWMLPGISGIQLAQHLSPRMPVLMVTARAESSDIVHGLQNGADDYITKPFDISILLARVSALLRRASNRGEREAQGALVVGDLIIDASSYRVTLGGEILSLTPSEFKVLVALMRNRGRVLSRQQLIDLVQGEGINVIDRTIDTHVFGLRKKLGHLADLIETVRGVGYRVSYREWEDAAKR